IQRFPGVAHAAVMITADTTRSIGRKQEPTATVEISTQDEAEPDRKLVDAAAAVVAGSTAGLKPANVNVVVNGTHMPTVPSDVSAGGLAGGNSQLELIQKHEQYR